MREWLFQRSVPQCCEREFSGGFGPSLPEINGQHAGYAAGDRMAAESPLYQMPSCSILRVQKNHPNIDGGKLTFMNRPDAAVLLPETCHS